jgi:WXG100 family type VII secretion target
MANYMIDLEQLNVTVIRISAFVAHLQEKLNALNSHVALLQDSWAGPAANAQHAAHIEWTAGAQQMLEGLDAMRAAAQAALSSYESAVAANLWMFGA